MLDRTVKLGETLSTLIRERGYSGNRQPVLDAVKVSAAALSQYARDQTRPSFQKLVALANFLEVSLDYLVFGTPSGIVADPEPVVARYVKEAVTGVQAQARAHSALVGRLGRVIADRIDITAREVAQEASSGGLVEDHELVRLESYATQANIVTIDLDANVIAMPDGTSAAGQFLEVVAHALGQGCTYRFHGLQPAPHQGGLRGRLPRHAG